MAYLILDRANGLDKALRRHDEGGGVDDGARRGIVEQDGRGQYLLLLRYQGLNLVLNLEID